MRNHNFGNVLDSESFWKNTLCSHLEQILRKYPDYKPDEYVVWFESSIFLPIQWRTMSAKILLKNENNDIVKTLLLSNDFKIGKPYPNKSLHQMRLKNGRGSVFGIPLVFKTFDDLKEIKHIDIIWEIAFTIQNETYVSLTSLRYDVDFLPDEHKRFYTISEYAVCNIIHGWSIKEDVEHYEQWLQEFDNTIHHGFKSNWKLSENQIDVINRNRINELYRSGVNWFITECYIKTCLKPTDFSSILDEPSFGFKQMHAEDFDDYQDFIDYHEKYYKHKWCGKE